MSNKVLIGVGIGAVLLLVGGYAADHFVSAAREEENAEKQRQFEQERYFPDGLTCAPLFNKFDRSIQHALNATKIDSFTSLGDDKKTVNFDSDIPGGTKCDTAMLREAFNDPRVHRLLEKCRMARLWCEREAVGIDITFTSEP